MILQRLATSIRKQDWFTVAIETLIVVLGVFIGLQVNNWNAARADRAEERQLLGRLGDEVHTLLDIQKSESAYHSPRYDAMLEIHPLLFDETPQRALSDVECHLIALSHWLPAPSDELPTLEEAIATGRIGLITDESVKANLRDFALVRGRARRQYDQSFNELYRLSPRHPNAVWQVRKAVDESAPPTPWDWNAGPGYSWWSYCDLEEMRGSKAFLAEYIDNASRMRSYAERYGQTIAALEALEGALANELGVRELSEMEDGAS